MYLVFVAHLITTEVTDEQTKVGLFTSMKECANYQDTQQQDKS